MGLRDLSEAIILQSALDLLDTPQDKDALEFFSGEGFRLCAQMAKMGHDDKITLLEMLTHTISACKENRNHRDKKPDLTDRKIPERITLSHQGGKSPAVNVA